MQNISKMSFSKSSGQIKNDRNQQKLQNYTKIITLSFLDQKIRDFEEFALSKNLHKIMWLTNSSSMKK